MNDFNNVKILWFVSTLEDTKFLKQFSRYFDGDIEVFHLNYITRLDLAFSKFKHHYPFRRGVSPSSDESIAYSFNVLAGRLAESDARLAYSSTNRVLENLNLSADWIFMIPSGRHVHHLAATAFAKKNGISRLYINYANFPGYVFFDPEGTDCLSSLYNDPERLDRLYPDEVDVDQVFKYFSMLKLNQKKIPQAAGSKYKKVIKDLSFFIDTWLQRTFGFYGDRRIEFSNNSGSLDNTNFSFDIVDDFSNAIFFPLQVSTDQQVLLNYSKGSIYKALDEVVGIAEKERKILCIKMHPAEGKKEEISNYLNLIRSSFEFVKVVDMPAPLLIERCREIITINSTVGLEAIINRKKVRFLGKSFYSKANDQQLAKYLNNYFVPVDYHKPILSKELIGVILRYCKE